MPARSPRAAAPVAGRRLEPTARRASEAATSAPQAEAEEEDPLPEDDKDPIQPAPRRAAAAPLDDDAPPPVARKGGQVSAMTERLAKLPRGA